MLARTVPRTTGDQNKVQKSDKS